MTVLTSLEEDSLRMVIVARLKDSLMMVMVAGMRLMDINIESHEECASESGCKRRKKVIEIFRRRKCSVTALSQTRINMKSNITSISKPISKTVLERMQGRLATFNLSRML
jgi:hypothetical protein